ncbi:MAG: acyl-CoA dehydrogenase family protein [Candidatus Azotimanducaceae bacterium WSBS_2022_MAG_OTU7]
MVKALCTELVNEVTSIGVHVHGGMGFIEETGAAQHYRTLESLLSMKVLMVSRRTT